MSNFFKTLDRSKKHFTSVGDVQACSILYRLESYIESGRYSEYKKANQFYALRNLKLLEIAALLGVSYDTVKRRRTSLSSEAWGCVGKDFFTLLDQGSYEECEAVVSMLDNDDLSQSLFPNGVTSIIEGLATSEDRSFLQGNHTPSTFVDEVNFLVSISEPVIKAQVSNLNVGKLLYLLGLLNGSVGSRKDKADLTNYILEKAGELL